MIPTQRGTNGRGGGQIRRPASFAAALNSRELADLLLVGKVVSYVDGQPLVAQGDCDTCALLVRRGRVAVRADAGDGRGVLLALLGPGDLIGEVRYLTGLPRGATVTASGAVLAVSVEFSALDPLVHRHPRMMREIGRCVAERLRLGDQRRAEFRLPVVTRVARVLCDLARVTTAVDPVAGAPVERGGGVVVPVTQRGLGELVGAAEVTVQKALRYLAHDGCIARRYGRVAITDMDTLNRHAYGLRPAVSAVPAGADTAG